MGRAGSGTGSVRLLALEKPWAVVTTVYEKGHWFARVAGTKYHKLDDFKQQEFIFSQFWRLGI